MLVFRGEDGGTAPGTVDVQPEVVLFADGGDGFEGVVRAEDGGAGCGVDVEGGFAFGFGFLNEFLEGGGDHPALRVDGDGPHVVGSETAHLSCFFEGVVAVC